MENDTADIALIFHKSNCIIEDFHRILNAHYKLKLFPKSLKSFNNSFSFENEIKKIPLIICVINNEFSSSEQCLKLIEDANEHKKSIISVIIEEIQNYDTVKQNILRKIEINFELYKERIYKTGYDQWLWISNSFNNLINEIEKILKKNLVSYCYFFANE